MVLRIRTTYLRPPLSDGTCTRGKDNYVDSSLIDKSALILGALLGS